MLKIESRDNQRIKQVRKVRKGREENLIFVEGVRLTEEVLRSGLRIEEVFIKEFFAAGERGKQLIERILTKQITVVEVAGEIFDSLSDTKTSQGVILICEKPETGKAIVEKNLQENLQKFPLLILLHQINNPSNLGAILRTAEAVDISGVILTKNSADVFSPKALRSAMGASFRLPIWTNADFFEVLSWAEEKHFVSVCADINAGKSYLEIDWKKPRLLIFGSEAHGLSAVERKEIEESLIIPMENDVESLNLAVSCGVILFEAKRQYGSNKHDF